MPGSVANAAPASVMPDSLFSAFRLARQYRCEENSYRNGESQRAVSPTTSRKRWEMKKKLTATQAAALRLFYVNRGGPLEEFYVYDKVTDTGVIYDAGGTLAHGRHTVRFEGNLAATCMYPRSEFSLALVEVA